MAMNFSLNFLKLLPRSPVRTLSYPSQSLTVPLEIPQYLDNPPRSERNIHQSKETIITTLSNGLRVATQESFGQYCTIGAFVDTGSRYEVDYPCGVTHFLSKLAFQSSSKYKTCEDLFKELELYGGLPNMQTFRDIIFYSISCFSFAAPQAMSILADMFWRPQIRKKELEDCRMAITSELEDLHTKPHPEALLMDLIHQASYRNNTLGLPEICTPDNISNIQLSDLDTYLASHFIPSRIVLVGVNVKHESFVRLVEEHFMNSETSWKEVERKPVDESISQYTGGQMKVPRESAPVIGPNRLPDLTHVAISLESSSFNHEDFFTYAVLNSLMGGGGSFSAGGPGKGMYTQLYLNVLNKYHWVYHAQALNHAYSDSGIFCLFGSSHPKQSRDLVEVLCKQFYQMTKIPNVVAVARAKKQLQSALMMNLESRMINFEDIGRQVIGHNKRLSAEELCQKIEAVTPEDLSRAGQKMYDESPPSLAALGDLSYLPDVREIEEALISKKGILNRRSFIFR